MGRGDNRKTLKVRRRKQWRRKKARLQNRIEEGKKASSSKPRASAKAAAPAVKKARRAPAKTATP